MPDTPAQTPAPAPAAPAAAPTAAGVEAAAAQAERKIAETTQAARAKLKASVPFWRKWLRMDDPGDAEEKSLLMTPPHLVNDLIDAVPLTIGRETFEIAETTLRNVDGALGVLSIPFGKKDPKTVTKKLFRPVTASAHFFTKSVGILPRVLDNVGNRGVKRPLQRVGYKTPLIGGLLTKGASAVGWLSRQPRKITDWLSDKTLAADNFMANHG